MTAGEEPAIPDVQLERFRLGELAPREMKGLRDRLAGDPGLQARLDLLVRSDGEIAAAYPAGRMVAEINERLELAEPEAPPWRLPWMRLVPAGAIVLILLAVALPTILDRRPTSDDVLVKGGKPSLVLYRRVAGGSERLEPGARVRTGDRIRIGYKATERAYGVIVSVDPRGTVTRHLPTEGQQAARLEPNGLVMLDSAYELDATPGWERFYFVTGSQAFEVEPTVRAAREAAARGTSQSPPALALPRQLDQFVFTLPKDDRE